MSDVFYVNVDEVFRFAEIKEGGWVGVVFNFKGIVIILVGGVIKDRFVVFCFFRKVLGLRFVFVFS